MGGLRREDETKMTCPTCSINSSSNECGGFKPPKKGQHLDTQLFPECPSRSLSEQKKRRKKKKAENMNWYKTAKETITGPDMNSLDPNAIERAKIWLEQKHPGIKATMDEIIDFIHNTQKPKTIQDRKENITGPIDPTFKRK
jgi:hypothetical protein